MALTKDSQIKASDFVALKNRVKAEMARRCRNGSVAAYATDYTNKPAANGEILPVHVNEIITPMSQVNDPGMSAVASGDAVVAIDVLDAKLTTWEAATMVKNGTNNCKSSCTGMCVSGCWNSCTSCTGCSGCGSGCATTCTSCTGCSGCGSGCATGCSGCGSCGGACSSSCSGCSGSCTGTCSGGCSGCSGSCTGYCGGCTGCTGCSGCGSGCANSCDTSTRM